MPETNVIMPQMGESIFEGTITKWLKEAGDTIQRDEPLFEISTDKIDSEIPSPAAGTLKEILIEEGETVEINTIVAVIAGSGSDEVSSSTESGKPRTEKPDEPKPASAQASKPQEGAVTPSSPMVRRMAREHGIDLGELEGKGTGEGGRITKRDIQSFMEQRVEEKSAGTEETGERVPMTAMRKSIAEHMTASKRTSAHAATVFEVDCSAILSARTALKAEFERAGVKLTITPFFIHAAARALRKFPVINSIVDGNSVVYKKTISVGVAVALDDGLIVPVIRKADELNLLDVARAVSDFGERARTKKLLPDEVGGGTFTVTNPGNLGGLFGIAIINQPQVAILEVGSIERRPVVVDDAIAVRPRAYIVLSFDHRIIDGVVADQFMANVKNALENWKP